MRRAPTATRVWIGVFAVWFALLSGAFAHLRGGRLGDGTPGVIQAVRLNSLLDSRHQQLADLQTELDNLNAEAERLERSRPTQIREIRRVLGYAAPDEIIFDFTAPESI